MVITAIDPDLVSRGSVTEVTITGSGFAAGMEVTFEGASGPRPKATDVTVVDGTITANVTVSGIRQPNVGSRSRTAGRTFDREARALSELMESLGIPMGSNF